MNVIRRLKQDRIEARKRLDIQERLSNIPESRLNGSDALPAELWGQVLDHLLLNEDEELCSKEYDLCHILELRLVCHIFDNEIQGILKRHLFVTQILRRTFMRNVYAIIHKEEPHFLFRNELLASALFNSSRHLNHHSTTYYIISRIRNCVLIAQHISSSFTPEHQEVLLRKFCSTASTSRSCWSYIFTLRHYGDGFVEHVDKSGDSTRKCDVRLEMALLIANGFGLKDVKEWMIRLGEKQRLDGYRDDVVLIGKPWRFQFLNHNRGRSGGCVIYDYQEYDL